MKFTAFILTALAVLPALAQQGELNEAQAIANRQRDDIKISSQVCTNASRGIVLILPEIAGGALTGPFRVTRLIRTLIEVSPAQAGPVSVKSDGLFAFSAHDDKGAPLLRVETTKDSVGRLVVEVHTKDQGLLGFTCPQPKAK